MNMFETSTKRSRMRLVRIRLPQGLYEQIQKDSVDRATPPASLMRMYIAEGCRLARQRRSRADFEERMRQAPKEPEQEVGSDIVDNR